MHENYRKCSLSDLTVTSKNYTFVPVTLDANIVTTFEIVRSRISVLTSNICTTLNKIKYFTAAEQHIERVEDYAFNNCTDVIEINLERNNIHKLGIGVFSNTKLLQRLRILGGSMDHIDVDLFSNLYELKHLLFSANGLSELPVAAMKNLKKLELLYIYSNNLDDLDVSGLVANLPRLKSIYLNDNNFHCDRLIEIMDTFKAGGIATPDYTFGNSIKRRDYIPRKIHNITCLTQAQLENENLKSALTGSLDRLNNFAMRSEVIQLKEIVSFGFKDADSAIVTLTNNFDETSDNLNKQILNLNETLHTNLHANTDTVNELKSNIKTVEKEFVQTGKDNWAVQQQLEARLNGMMESYQEHDKLIASLMDKCVKLSSLDEIRNGNGNRIYKSFGNNMVSVWVCIVVLIVVDVAIVMVGITFIKKFRRFYAIECRKSEYLLQETSLATKLH